MKRIFIPGSEWLYLKLYTGHKSADNLLINFLYPLGKELEEKNIINDFFFVRYSDPKFHIRLRLKIEDVLNYAIVVSEIEKCLAPCVETGVIVSVQCDTYNRELERYGENFITDIESLFCCDSQAIMELLCVAKESDTSEEDRWKISLLLIDDMLSAFDYTLDDKRVQMERMSSNFKNEFGFKSHTFTKQLNDKYRSMREQIDNVLSDRDESMLAYKYILEKRKNEIRKIASSFNENQTSKDSLLYNLIHMTMNRTFRSKNRLHEMVIYDFIYRYYQSAIAQAKYNK